MPVTVSIVIPTFNRAVLLKRCIESALVQTYPCEVLVCDHGSSDSTPSVVAAYGSRVRYLRRERDSGVHFAWLDAVLSASGEFIHLNYDDDFIRPTFVEKCMELMAPDVAFCFTDAELQDLETGRTLATEHFRKAIGPSGTWPASKFMDFQMFGLVSPGATLIRRNDIVDNLFVGRIPFSRREYRGVGPDWLMTAMTSLRYPKVGFIAESLAVFTAHAGSITIEAMNDPTRARNIQSAYEEARRYYSLAEIVQTFRLDRLAGLWSRLYRCQCRLKRRLGGSWPGHGHK